MRDETYDLVSTLYHCLQGSWNCQEYIEDAEKSDNAELATFFREAQAYQQHVADRAKVLLKAMLNARGVEEEEEAPRLSGSRHPESDAAEDISSKESFPASDPPGTY